MNIFIVLFCKAMQVCFSILQKIHPTVCDASIEKLPVFYILYFTTLALLSCMSPGCLLSPKVTKLTERKGIIFL